MKFSYQLVTSALAVFVLSACSDSPVERNQAEKNFDYLNTPAFSQWQTPEDAVPEFNNEFTIPQGNFSGETGKNLDIRPPLQVLELIPGVRIEHDPGVVTLWTVQPDYADNMWAIIKSLLQRNHASLTETSETALDGKDMIWSIGDDEGQVKASYDFSRISSGSRQGIRIEITRLTDDLDLPGHDSLLDRYTVAMANLITGEYDAQLQAKAQREAERLGQHIVFTMGTDRSGLPVIIARSAFDITWHRMPVLLEQFGFEVTDKSQSQGSMDVKYRRPDDNVWQGLGAEPLGLERGKYTLMLGDLGNRTSINITDSEGKLLSEAQLQAFVPVLSAVSGPKKN